MPKGLHFYPVKQILFLTMAFTVLHELAPLSPLALFSLSHLASIRLWSLALYEHTGHTAISRFCLKHWLAPLLHLTLWSQVIFWLKTVMCLFMAPKSSLCYFFLCTSSLSSHYRAVVAILWHSCCSGLFESLKALVFESLKVIVFFLKCMSCFYKTKTLYTTLIAMLALCNKLVGSY